MPSERVLVVDDDPVILMLCQRILEVDGYSVASVKRGEDALARLENESFDLLLTDIRLPGLDGLEVTTRLRERGLEIVVITMTGYSNMEMAIQALSLGVDEFIIKPFTPDTLRVHVSRALEKEKLRRENMRLRMLLPLLSSSQVFATARSISQIHDALLEAARTQLEIEHAAVLALDARGDALVVVSTLGAHFEAIHGQQFSFFEFSDLHELLGAEARVWPPQTPGRFPFLPLNVPFISVSLQTRDRIWGVLIVESPGHPSSSVEYLGLLATHASTAIENVDLVEQVSQAFVRLRELDHLKSEFINIAGHELRTPLAVIRGYAKLLCDRLNGQEREFADQVLSSAARLQRIVDQMLHLKYLEHEQGITHPEWCNVENVVHDVVETYQNAATEKEQTIEARVQPECGQVWADRAMLGLTLASLIANAIKFSSRHTQIHVAAMGDADNVTMSVTDEGKGLTPEQAARVFDPFYQADHSLTRQEGGLGLGLTLAREMVHAHGGKIWVESKIDHGSTFYVTLPRQYLLAVSPEE